MKRFIAIVFAISLYTALPAGQSPRIEVVFCLDLSGSTNGLIDDFRNNYWQLVKNINASANGQARVGFIGYSRPSFGATSSYVKIFSDLSNDYENLAFSINQLKTNIEKGDQFIPNVLYTATLGLNWSKENNTQKIIFLVGNGKVQTGKFDFRKACELAKENNIKIYAVNYQQKTVSTVDIALWQTIAKLTGGQFESVKTYDKERIYGIAEINEEISDFNKKFSSTFIYYGIDGAKRYKMMNQTDTFCMRLSSKEFYARCDFKLTSNYIGNAASWDLVSQSKISLPDFKSIDRKTLPDSLQNLDVKKLTSIIKSKKEERDYLIVQFKNALQRSAQPASYECQLDSILNSTIKKIAL